MYYWILIQVWKTCWQDSTNFTYHTDTHHGWIEMDDAIYVVKASLCYHGVVCQCQSHPCMHPAISIKVVCVGLSLLKKKTK